MQESLLFIQVASCLLPRPEAVLPVNSVGSEGCGTFLLFGNPLSPRGACLQLPHKHSLLPPPILLRDSQLWKMSELKTQLRRLGLRPAPRSRRRRWSPGRFRTQKPPCSGFKNGSQVFVLAESTRVSRMHFCWFLGYLRVHRDGVLRF